MSGRPKSEAKARRIAREHAVDPKCRACRRPTTLRAVGEDPGPLDAVLARWLARDDPRNLTFKSQKIRRLVCLEFRPQARVRRRGGPADRGASLALRHVREDQP